MADFALIGAAGYIAPRHMQAISETGNNLVAALDTSDSVGVLDGYFPDAHFFTEFERFDRHLDKLRRKNDGHGVDYVSICSPNYLHDAHVRFALRSGAHAICEKPLVINPWNLDGLAEVEQDTGKRVKCILQLRLHPSLIALKQKIEAANKRDHEVELSYITPRGLWYHASWKGNEEKSGGVATNIGVHFFDMLMWLFGSVEHSTVQLRENNKIAGVMQCERARIHWYLSVDAKDLERMGKERKPYRSIKVDGEEIEFSNVFRDLHTESYAHILNEGGYGIEDVRPSIELLHSVRHTPIEVAQVSNRHPLIFA